MKLLNTLPSSRRIRRGFTLMELLLVLAIIGLLMGGGAAVYSGIMDGAKGTKTRSKIGTISMQLQQYQAQKSGRLPSQSLGLNALKSMGAVKTDEELLDSWGEPLIYTYPAKKGGDQFDLWSKGPDKLENTPDDIGNWISE